MTHDDPMPTFTGITRDQKLYRIVDFFSAANTISENSIYIPLADRFEDPNEGIDAAIGVLSISGGPCAGITRFFKTTEEFIAHQNEAKKRNYVSCWTKTKESVAMWALYSQDKCSVQISTTAGKLEECIKNLAQINYNPLPAISSGLEFGQFLDSSHISSVQYESLRDLGIKIDRRRRAYDKLEATGKIQQSSERLPHTTRELARSNQYYFASLQLKDLSFAHEAEIRLILNFTPYTPETLSIASKKIQEIIAKKCLEIDTPKVKSYLLRYSRAILKEQAWKLKIPCAHSINLPITENFVSDATIDPRCSPHKRKFIEDHLRSLKIPIMESTCFGHAVNHFSVQPRRSLLLDHEKNSVGQQRGRDTRDGGWRPEI